MKSLVWSKALKNCADPQRARHYLDLLAATTAADAIGVGDRGAGADFGMRAVPAVHKLLEQLADCASGAARESHARTSSTSAPGPRIAARRRQLPEKTAGPGHACGGIRAIAPVQATRDAAHYRRDQRLANVGEIILELSEVADVCLDAVLATLRVATQ